MKVRLHAGARREYLAAFRHYEKAEIGLGRRFAEHVEAGFDSIAAHPLAWPLLNSFVRKRVIARFPYTILYVPRSDEIFVLAIMHQKRRPGY